MVMDSTLAKERGDREEQELNRILGRGKRMEEGQRRNEGGSCVYRGRPS